MTDLPDSPPPLRSLQVDVGPRLAEPDRAAAQGNPDPTAGSGIIGGEEDGCVQYRSVRRVGVIDLRELFGEFGAPAPGGAPQA